MAVARRLLAEGRPVHAQGSRRRYAGLLAAELSRRAGGEFRTVFANSGAEAVEAALKHALLETGSRAFVALEGGFHGKTLGAVQLTDNPFYRESFELGGLEVRRVPPNDVAALERAFAAGPAPAGFVFEPIQGEGGVRPLEPAFLARAAELCRQSGARLIADEVQCGMGRTGTFLACQGLGIEPDYVVLSKALGGGIAKVAALLVRSEHYQSEFDLLHTSTYAEDDVSCAVALEALRAIDGGVLEACRAKGERLLDGLEALRARYPGVIRAVRGRGLMLGVEFQRLTRSPSFLLRLLASQDDLVLALVGYLFNVHRIRVAPTLSDPHTLRLEPSARIAEADLDRFLEALADVCARLEAGDALGLSAYFMNGEPQTYDEVAAVGTQTRFFVFNEPEFWKREEVPAPEVRVGWLCHMIDADDLIALERPFERLPFQQREDLLRHLATRVNPVVMSSADVTSATGARARLHAVLLPFTSRRMKEWIDARRLERAQRAVQRGVDVARELGCDVVSLGQYTSIVTSCGLSVDGRGMGVTTGNSYAVALALEAVARAHAELGRDPGGETLAIVGAAGNIGRVCAELCAGRYRELILVGSEAAGSLARLRELAARLPGARVTTRLGDVRAAGVVISAVNAVDAPLGPEHLAPGAIVCDLSVPSSLQRAIWTERPDLFVFKGGLAGLPGGEDLGIVGFPLEPGQTYGCMAEGLLLGFEGVRDRGFTGSLRPAHVARVSGMAARHGFGLADYKRLCVLGSQRRGEPGAHVR